MASTPSHRAWLTAGFVSFIGRLCTAAAVLAASAALGGLAAPAGAQTSSYQLVLSTSATRSSPVALSGATVAGNAYVFVAPESGVSRVRFWLDNTAMTGTPRKTESNAPWDFAGTASDMARSALPFDTRTVSDGQHTISAAIDKTGGGTDVVHATFVVANNGPVGDRAPDQIHLAWVGDPSTTMRVVWRTLSAAASSQMEYRVAGSPTWQTATGALRSSGTTGMLHEAALSLLTPSTEYEYRLPGDGAASSPVLRFRTAPAPGAADFDFVYVADTGLVGRLDGLATGTQQVVDEIVDLDPLLVLPGGDYAYFNTDTRYGTLDNTIDAWFNQMQPIASRSPLMPVYGNHEALLGENVAAWSARFPTPSGFDGRRNYSFDVGDVHFVAIFSVFDTQGLTSSQLAWIEQDIEAAQAAGKRWIIPYFHTSPFADGTNHHSNLALRSQLGPLFESLGVKLVISSHDQAYERTYPLTDVPATNTPTSSSKTCYTTDDGVTWVKTSPGGKLSNISGGFSPFATTPPPPWTARRSNTMHNFAHVIVSATGTLTVQIVGVTGTGSPPVILDSFQIRDGSTCPPEPTITYALVNSTSSNRAAPGPLSDATLSGNTYVFTTPDTDVTRVRFWLDNPTMTGTPRKTESNPPFDFAGTSSSGAANPFDTRTVSDGQHTITAALDKAGGGTEVVHATFVISNQVASSFSLVYSTSPDRSAPSGLAGATVSGNVHAFVTPEAGATRVRFWLDNPNMTGTPRKTESNAPWDFAGTASDPARSALPFDTRTIGDGGHTITAAIDKSGGGTDVLNATFTVDNG